MAEPKPRKVAKAPTPARREPMKPMGPIPSHDGPRKPTKKGLPSRKDALAIDKRHSMSGKARSIEGHVIDKSGDVPRYEGRVSVRVGRGHQGSVPQAKSRKSDDQRDRFTSRDGRTFATKRDRDYANAKYKNRK